MRKNRPERDAAAIAALQSSDQLDANLGKDSERSCALHPWNNASLLHFCLQAQTIEWCGALLVVVKININVKAARAPNFDRLLPSCKYPGRVVSLVASARPVPPHINKMAVRFHGAGASA